MSPSDTETFRKDAQRVEFVGPALIHAQQTAMFIFHDQGLVIQLQIHFVDAHTQAHA